MSVRLSSSLIRRAYHQENGARKRALEFRQDPQDELGEWKWQNPFGWISIPFMAIREEIREVLQSHRADLGRMGVTRLSIFGSVVRGDDRPDSDVDVLVEFSDEAKRDYFSRFMDLAFYLEKILGLRPDLVILIPESSSPRMEEAIRRAGIETLVVRTDTLPSVFQAITSIAEKTGTAAAGRKLTDSIHEEMRALEARIPRGARKKVLVVIQRKPLIAAGGRNFFDALVRQAGADNIAGDSSLPYPRFSMDSVIAGKPDVILDLDPSPTEDSWSVYATLPAVQAGRIFQMTPDHFLPGPRVAKSLEILIEKIHGIPP